VEDPYKGWPPLKLYSDGSLDLEFGPLLLADSVIMDQTSYDRLTNSNVVALRRAADSLRTLKDEGYLQTKELPIRIEPY
jgi:hypothetical protein